MQWIIRKIFGLLLLVSARAAIVPPPWANPSSNPCAAQPRGWQLLFWPPDGKCYKIFQVRKQKNGAIDCRILHNER